MRRMSHKPHVWESPPAERFELDLPSIRPYVPFQEAVSALIHAANKRAMLNDETTPEYELALAVESACWEALGTLVDAWTANRVLEAVKVRSRGSE